MTVISMQTKRAQKREVEFARLMENESFSSSWAVVLLRGMNTLFQQLTEQPDHDFLGDGLQYQIEVGRWPLPVVLQVWGTDPQELASERFMVIERRTNTPRSQYQTLDVHSHKCAEKLTDFVEVWRQRLWAHRSPEEIVSVPLHSVLPNYVLGVLCGMMAKVRHYDFDYETMRCAFRIVSDVDDSEYFVRIHMDAIKADQPRSGKDGE